MSPDQIEGELEVFQRITRKLKEDSELEFNEEDIYDENGNIKLDFIKKLVDQLKRTDDYVELSNIAKALKIDLEGPAKALVADQPEPESHYYHNLIQNKISSIESDPSKLTNSSSTKETKGLEGNPVGVKTQGINPSAEAVSDIDDFLGELNEIVKADDVKRGVAYNLKERIIEFSEERGPAGDQFGEEWLREKKKEKVIISDEIIGKLFKAENQRRQENSKKYKKVK